MDFLIQDLFFSYKNVFRFLLVLRYGLFFNSFQIPLLKHLLVFFKVFNILDLDEVRGFNYAYFVRFFFGRNASFSKVTSVFHLNITYFSYKAFCRFSLQDGFFPLSIFINDIAFVSYSDSYLFKFFSWKSFFFYITFSDMNIFLEKKTNLGFYNLKDSLKFRLSLTGNSLLASSFLLYSLKIPFLLNFFF